MASMRYAMPERPRYSTGFRIALVAMAVAAFGGLALANGAHLVGICLLTVGLITLAANFGLTGRGFDKTWPDDFPILAPLFGREPHPERWAPRPDWWETAPARSRLARGAAVIVAGAVLIGLAVTGHNVTSAGDAPIWPLGVLLLPFGVLQVCSAWRDLRAP
jgi:hypothetical protein